MNTADPVFNNITTPATVLMIDDAQELAEIVAGTFYNEPIKVISALNGKEGLRMATSCPIDLILLDIGMLALMALKY